MNRGKIKLKHSLQIHSLNSAFNSGYFITLLPSIPFVFFKSVLEYLSAIKADLSREGEEEIHWWVLFHPLDITYISR